MTLATHHVDGIRAGAPVRSALANTLRKRLSDLAASGSSRWFRARNLACTRRCLLRQDEAFLRDIGMSRERLGARPSLPIPPQEYLWGQR